MKSMTPNFFQKVLVISGFLVVSGLNLGVAEAYVSNKYVNKGGCYLQKEYNYFMNQWTTNEVCRPKFTEEPVQQKIASPYTTTGSTDNIYLGPSYSNSYTAPVTYYTGPSLDAIHTARSSGNSWNGYGNSANYLLGSFGGGIGSYGYYNNYYPNSVFTYTPTSYSAYNSWYGNYNSPSYSDYSYSNYDAYDYAEDFVYSNPQWSEPDYYSMAQDYGQANGLSSGQVDNLYYYGYDSVE